MAGLKAQIETSPGVWEDAALRSSNVTGSALVSAIANDSGEAIGGSYRVTLSSVVPGVSADFSVAAGSGANPYDGRTGSLAADGSTPNKGVVGGVDLVVSASAADGDEIRLDLGYPWPAMDAFAPAAGRASDPVRVRVQNDGSLSGESCRALLLPIAKRYQTTPGSPVLDGLRTFADDAVEKASDGHVQPYVAAASNVTGSGDSKTLDVEFDGALVNVQDQTSLATGTSAALKVTRWYRVLDGDLKDVEFKPAAGASNGNEENLMVFAPRFVQLATDISGAPGGDFGTDPVTLTEADHVDGVVSPGGFAFYQKRLLAPSGSPTASNPYPVEVCLEGRAPDAAGWKE
jgi:hypothetical protein